MENFMILCSIGASITSIIVNGYTIYTIRKQLGGLLSKGEDKVKENLKKLI